MLNPKKRWQKAPALLRHVRLGLLGPRIFNLLQVQNLPYRECAGEKELCISSEYVGLREIYFNCKRGQIRRNNHKSDKKTWCFL